MLSPGAIIGQGRYCITRELGKGTFGIVYLALDRHVNNREVAIKALNARIHDAETTAKFLHEVDIIAAFDHPNIVRVLDAGIEGNIPFFVMNYALHGTLRQHYPKGTQVPLQEVVSCVKQVAEALQYAHDQEIVHRDVKPENLLLGRNREVLLSDFGIATIVPTTTTARGERHIDTAGTPLYMAPEQFNASPSRRSDQYSLAVIAYEWLCGQTPFVGNSYVQLAYQHVHAEPPSLCAQVPTLSHAVEHVILKALDKEREQRYPRVQEFAEALEEAATTGLRGYAATTPGPRGYSAQTTLCTYKEHTDWIYTLVWLADGQRIASAGNDKTIQSWDAINGGYSSKYREHSQRVTDLALSPNGRYLASASLDKTVQVREVASSRLVHTFAGHKAPVNTVSWSPDNTRLVSGGNDHNVRLWDIATGNQISMYQGHNGQINAVSWSANGAVVASASHDRTVQIWKADSGQCCLLYRGHTDWVMALVWSPDGNLVASAGRDCTIQIWDAVTGRLVFEPIKHEKPVLSLAWSPDGKQIAFGSHNKVQVWDLSIGHSTNRRSLSFTYTNHKSWVRTVAWSPDGTRIASAGDDKKVQVWHSG